MFENELTEPINLQQARALKRRLPEKHPKLKAVEEQIRILNSGYKGEKTLRYYLGLLPEKKYHIFQGLRLPIGKDFFQIDGLLISPDLILILEAKNHSGTLIFEKQQMIHEWKDQKEIYQNPLTQANRHKILLKSFFEKFQIPIPPIEYFAVVTNSSTEIKIAPGYHEAEKKVCRAGDLLKKIEEVEKYYNKQYIDPKSITKVRKLLLNKHTPLRIDYLKQLGIAQSEILTGVLCPKCFFLPMVFNRMNWKCPKCLFTSKDAHLAAIDDHFLLIKPTINNPELRKFLHIPSARSATYIFSLLNLPHSGSQKGRIYHQPNFPYSSNHVFQNPNKQ